MNINSDKYLQYRYTIFKQRYGEQTAKEMLNVVMNDEEEEKAPEVAKGIVKCKCGSEHIHIKQKQTRSMDEGATVFCKCNDCGRMWKE